MLQNLLSDNWQKLLENEFKKDYFLQLMNFYELEKKSNKIFPPENKLFSAFNFTSIENLKVVIIGQDPYHGLGQANGLCFSVSDGIKKPPSLQNVFKELQSDLGYPVPETGNLEPWAKQGVLMLNRSLTAQQNNSKSDRDKWKKFFGYIIYLIEFWKPGTIFLLWGKEAQKYAELLSQNNHVFSWEHPMTAHNKRQPWECPNFKQIDKLLESLDGGSRKIIW